MYLQSHGTLAYTVFDYPIFRAFVTVIREVMIVPFRRTCLHLSKAFSYSRPKGPVPWVPGSVSACTMRLTTILKLR